MIRLDQALVERGLCESREKAKRAIMAGTVKINGQLARKPSDSIKPDDELAVTEPEKFVSRGGHKLEHALEHFQLDVTGLTALDIGASTGGFTDCLLQAGAEHVVAYDVAYGELDWSLRTNERVTVIERANARRMERDELPYAPDLIVADVSFISLTKVLPAVLACAAPRFDALTMIKPQFEVGRDRVGSGGVVRDPEVRCAALVEVARAVRDGSGVSVLGFATSGLPGPKGNRESFAWLAEAGRAGALDDDGLVAAAAATETAVQA